MSEKKKLVITDARIFNEEHPEEFLYLLKHGKFKPLKSKKELKSPVVIKKEYVFTVKDTDGKIKEIRKPINLYHSHRSCIVDFDNSFRNERKQCLKDVLDLIKKKEKTLKEEVDRIDKDFWDGKLNMINDKHFSIMLKESKYAYNVLKDIKKEIKKLGDV